jgi:hypothetical protein
MLARVVCVPAAPDPEPNAEEAAALMLVQTRLQFCRAAEAEALQLWEAACRAAAGGGKFRQFDADMQLAYDEFLRLHGESVAAERQLNQLRLAVRARARVAEHQVPTPMVEAARAVALQDLRSRLHKRSRKGE